MNGAGCAKKFLIPLCPTRPFGTVTVSPLQEICYSGLPMKRYQPYSDFLKTHFGAKVYKVALDAGFTCPNRDGKAGRGGCTFCAEGSRAGYVDPSLSLRGQMEAGMAKYREKYGAQKFLAYFQAYTNTHGPLPLLRRVLSEPLDHPDVVGLSVGTRPDCVGDDVLELLKELARDRYLLLEMGIQSLDDKILAWINRGHDAAAFVDAVQRSVAKGLRVCAHVILGFPGETVASVTQMAKLLSSLGIDGIKIHNLHVIANTPLANTYREGGLPMITRGEYTLRVRLLLENLSPKVWVHRVTGEVPAAEMLAPDWALNKTALLAAIAAELETADSYQGKFV